MVSSTVVDCGGGCQELDTAPVAVLKREVQRDERKWSHGSSRITLTRDELPLRNALLAEHG